MNDNWFTPRGTGYAKGATQQQQRYITESHDYLKPTKDLFAGYLSGNKTMGDMPSFMQTPDWRTTQNDVYDAWNRVYDAQNDVYGAMTPLADINARDLFEKNNAILQQDRLKSGNIYGSAGTATSLPDLMTFVAMQKAKDRAAAAMYRAESSKDKVAAAKDQIAGLMYRAGAYKDMVDAYKDMVGASKDRVTGLTNSLDVGAMLRGEAGTNWWNMLKTIGDIGDASALSSVAQNYGQIGANQTNFMGNLLKSGIEAAALFA